MNNSKKRHCGSAYRRFETMMNYYAKPGKDRTNAPPPTTDAGDQFDSFVAGRDAD